MTPAQASQWRLAVSVAKFAPDTGETTIPSGTVLAVEADRAALLEALKFVMSAHGEQLDLAFQQAHDVIRRVEGKQ